MKIKNVLFALIVSPIIAYIITQVLWLFYPYLPINLSVAAYSDITIYAGLGIFALLAYASLRKSFNQKAVKKLTRKKENSILEKDVETLLIPSKKSAVLEFIIMGAGKNFHKVMPFNREAKYKINGSTYEIKNKNLFVQKTSFKTKYFAIFHNDKPLEVSSATGNITAEILSLAQRSTAVKNKIKEMFTTHLDLKKILFFVIIGVVAVVIIFVLTGGFF